MKKTNNNSKFNSARYFSAETASLPLWGVLVLIQLLFLATPAISMAEVVGTLAGNGIQGFVDGPGYAAQFNYPRSVATDASGNVYVGTLYDYSIRKIDPAGNVTTLAGTGTQGFADGPGSTAQFSSAYITADPAGNVYVADYDNHRIRKIDTSGNVTTVAGSGVSGFTDGPAATAQFYRPSGITVDGSGNLYVTDRNNHSIRKVDPAGNVTTLAGTGTSGFLDGPGATAQFNAPSDIDVDGSGNLYVVDKNNHRIRKIDTSNNVSTIAGTGTWGFADGAGTSAQFSYPSGIAIDGSGNLYIGDSSNHRIRKIDTANNVSTLAGTGTAEYTNGPAATAQFRMPYGIALATSGDILVGDDDNQRIRKISAADTFAPWLVPFGGNVIVEQGFVYTEPGYIAFDDVDGDVTGNVIVGGDTVDANAAVSTIFTITYDVEDAATNAAVQATRSVTIVAEGSTGAFPANGVFPTGWGQPVGSDLGWRIDQSTASEGTVSLRSGAITDDQTSAMQFTATTGVENITFDYKTDSEPSGEGSGDELIFYIDGSEQDRWSGDSGGWVTGASYPVTAGFHTFTWVYEKNCCDSLGADTVWIDNVVLPSGLPTGDTTPPVISLVGGDISVGQGYPYTDPGYSAFDDIDGDVSGSVIVGGDTVDTNAPVTTVFTITYNVSDAADNQAAQVTRLVTVIDPGSFPPGGTFPTGWVQTIDSDLGWEVDLTTASEGVASLRSGPITDSQTSEVEFTTATSIGNMTFDYKIDTEANFDFLQFYIDNDLKNQWSGNSGWVSVSYPVSPAGSHTFKWIYWKDGSASSGADAVWIDNVVLPSAGATVSGTVINNSTVSGPPIQVGLFSDPAATVLVGSTTAVGSNFEITGIPDDTYWAAAYVDINGNFSPVPDVNEPFSTVPVQVDIAGGVVTPSSPTVTIDPITDGDSDGVGDFWDSAPADPLVSGVDSDSDGIDDAWEQYYFGNLTTATATSDFNLDLTTDLEDFQNGGDPTHIGVQLVKDFNPAADGSYSPQSGDSAVMGSTYYFVIDDGINGYELWKSDGTETGTMMVKDINPGAGGSTPRYLTVIGNTLYFAAYDVTHGMELWKSDGTEAGTVMVKDIRPGSGSSISATSLTGYSELIVMDGILYFSAVTDTSGDELWRSDGTEAGTEIVLDLCGSNGLDCNLSDLSPGSLTVFNGMLYFAGGSGWDERELYRTDGTQAGTELVWDFGGFISSGPTWLTVFNNELYLSAGASNGRELYKVGTNDQAELVKDINTGGNSSDPRYLTVVGSTLFFSAEDDTNGVELWKTDGTTVGTVMVKDINPSGHSSPSYLTDANGTLYFIAPTVADGVELWKSDGTEAGTVMVKDIWPGTDSSVPSQITPVGSKLYFAAVDGIHGRELWVSDGTSIGTNLVQDINPGSNLLSNSSPAMISQIGSKLYFVAKHNQIGYGLWVLDVGSDPDSDGDGVVDSADAFPNDVAASVDSDGDGHPDAWNTGKTEVDSTTGLTLDVFPADPNEWDDSDADGVGDNGDAFPNDIAASLDSDGDGYPDEWNLGYNQGNSTTGLTLDECPSTLPIRLVGGAGYSQGLQWVYDLSTLSPFTIQAHSYLVEGSLVLDEAKEVTIMGGFNCDFSNNSSSPSIIQSLTISMESLAVTIDNIEIR